MAASRKAGLERGVWAWPPGDPVQTPTLPSVDRLTTDKSRTCQSLCIKDLAGSQGPLTSQGARVQNSGAEVPAGPLPTAPSLLAGLGLDCLPVFLWFHR